MIVHPDPVLLDLPDPAVAPVARLSTPTAS